MKRHETDAGVDQNVVDLGRAHGHDLAADC
jgi:hypothetical protein